MVVCKYFQKGYCKFGPSCRFEHPRDSKYSYRAPQSTTYQNNGFNQATAESNNKAASFFRSAVQNQPFDQNPQRTSVFNRLGTQANLFVSNESHKAKSVFAQANQNGYGRVNSQNQSTIQNPFTSTAKSVFAQASQNMFSQVQNQNVTSYPNKAASIFSSAVSSTFSEQSNSPFSKSSANIFQISERPSNVFANNSFDQALFDENIYSKLEELSENDINAYKSAEFRLGCIPELPPPKSLCA